MEESQTQRTANVALAEARIANILLMEMAAALIARGTIQQGEVAGALLRMKWRADVADEVDEESGDIKHHASIAELTISEWDRRFGLAPDLHALQTEQDRWLNDQQKDRSPWDPEKVAELYPDLGEQR